MNEWNSPQTISDKKDTLPIDEVEFPLILREELQPLAGPRKLVIIFSI